MISDEYWTTYHEKLAESDLHTHTTSFIPQDWALNAVDIASKWVEQQFAVHVAGRPLVPTPPELDPETALACGHLAFVLAEAYQHPNVVKLDIDIIRYNEALAKQESGLNDAREEALLAKFPPAERMFLDSPSVVIDAGYRIILWYLPVGMGDLLRKSITTRNESTGRTSKWWTNNSNFRAAMEPGLIPGCINISPCWFQQGRECQGPPSRDPRKRFIPEVSGTLKGDSNLSSIMDMQRPALLSSAALRVMHLQLYRASMSTHVKLGLWAAEQGQDEMYRCLQHWVSAYTGAAVVCNRDTPGHRDPKCPPEGFDILTSIGSYDNAVMNLTNLGIDLAYNPGVMVSYSGRLVRHGIQVSEGDRIVWAWFMRDSVHNHARTPWTEYAKYNLADFAMYHLARYNQADFVRYRT
ncbi:uncharacterized protein F5891DRAFT_982687 [Suillus fuscotomentosus]|uniref:Uncharacterized protein n=1 Tax=Suillus fuscotomentosus TaxID=1912939 RepID=A0AAD4E055_9AGAM|nr:uncharacterized protein F5891DRAFT_982687 [Suillus fuscotomentosus]KAG1897294.1 hypothetical protein F5891DRAFT_982687 [Suillus fuscotomentosus]